MFSAGSTHTFSEQVENGGTANALQAGLWQNMVMLKVTIQVHPTETSTARPYGWIYFHKRIKFKKGLFYVGHKTYCKITEPQARGGLKHNVHGVTSVNWAQVSLSRVFSLIQVLFKIK